MENTDKVNSLTNCEQRRSITLARRTMGQTDKGQALLELALVLPFLLLLLIGGLEFGILACASIQASNAAAAGALYGAQNHATASDNAGMTQAALNDASALPGASVLTVTPSTSCACQTGLTPTVIACSSTTGCVSPSRVIQWVKVDTTATINPFFHYPGLPNTFAVQGHATMRVQQ